MDFEKPDNGNDVEKGPLEPSVEQRLRNSDSPAAEVIISALETGNNGETIKRLDRLANLEGESLVTFSIKDENSAKIASTLRDFFDTDDEERRKELEETIKKHLKEN